MEKELWIALPLLLGFFQWWGELGNEIFPNLPPIKWTEAGEGLTQTPAPMKTFWKRTRIPQNNSHPTNYTANLSHFDDYMTLKTPVKPVSLLQEHLPKILELTVFSINPLPLKYEHAERNLCHQRNETCPIDPAPGPAVPGAPAGLFVPALPRMCQHVLCSLLLGDEPSGPHCPMSKNIIFLFSSFYFSPHLTYTTPLPSLPSLPSSPAGWQ